MPTETGSVSPESAPSSRQERRPSAGPSVPERLAEQFKSLGVARTFGEPLQVGGDTVVPVALVQYGFGGGGDAGGAAGGGGGGLALPLGAYTGRGDGPATFRPNTVALLAVLIPLVWTAGRAVARVVRAAKK
jgi:hypothetical protein